MNREIKFRAWNKKKKKMHNVTTLYLDESQNHSQGAGFSDLVYWNSLKDHELMQYTGLKDRNGKEIFEGDIIKDSVNGGFGFIEYNVKEMKFSICPGWFNPIFQMGYPADREVIGNVFENPNLIKESK